MGANHPQSPLFWRLADNFQHLLPVLKPDFLIFFQQKNIPCIGGGAMISVC